MTVFRDTGYRTRLGLSFYNRLQDLERLESFLRAARTLIIYGPRGVGKSELVRYYLSRRTPRLLGVLVDVRRRAAERLGVHGSLGDVARLLGENVSHVLGTGSLVRLVESISRALRGLYGGLVVIDEFHLLYRDREEAIAELERVAGYLAKTGHVPHLVLTVSEGFVATSRARRRLIGYSARYMLLEGLGKESMEALYNEYRERYGCGIGFQEYWGVFGGAPGYLVDACPLSREELLGEYIPSVLRDTVDEAIARLSEELSREPREVLGLAAKLLEEQGDKPLFIQDPVLQRLAEQLVEYNVLYPCRKRAAERYLPQLPVYGAAIVLAAQGGYSAASLVPPSVLEKALEKNEWSSTRCLAPG